MTAAIEKRLSEEQWWLVLLQGIAVLILGILLLTATGLTTAVLVVFMGLYFLVDGVFSIVKIFLKSSDIHWGWLLLRGVLGIIVGIIVLQHPLWATILVPTILVIILGIQGLISGGIGLYQSAKGAGFGTGMTGVINIIFGLILLFNPLFASWLLPLILGIFGIIAGIGVIILAFRLRKA